MVHKFFKIVCIIFPAMLLSVSSTFAKELYNDRPYQPVVLEGYSLREFVGVPVNEMFVYSYKAASGTWQMIPFQIDEKVQLKDPFYDQRAARHFYAIANTNPAMYSITDTLSAFDLDDELVFLVGDLGDKAADKSWIEDANAKTHDRLEIEIYDPQDPSNVAYAYLFRSSTLTMPAEVANKYGMKFNPDTHVVESKYYSVRLSKESGLVADVIIKPPFGTGVDIFDTQKIRFAGLIDFGLGTIQVGHDDFPPAREADNLYVYPNTDPTDPNGPRNEGYLAYTSKPVVRVIREVRQTLRFGEIYVESLGFYVKTFFYPFSGTIEGGTNLLADSLRDELDPNEDYYIQFDVLRQSWDFSPQAAGMKFYNKYNSNVLVDGAQDAVNKTIDVPIREWTLVSGAQGTMFTHVTFVDTSWKAIQLYYYDNKGGGQADSDYVGSDDTGDDMSYGDQGILFLNSSADADVSLSLGFTAYFLEANKDQQLGTKLATWVEHPVKVKRRLVTEVQQPKETALPDGFALYQNYPNPFNSSTKICFSLQSRSQVKISIYDINGRLVNALAEGEFSAGYHEIYWSGLDETQKPVPSGVYFYELSTENNNLKRKLVVLR
jgi:hypothetical protein